MGNVHRLILQHGVEAVALDAEGGLLLFEANATMALVPPPPEPLWDYRRPAFAAALAAARALMQP